MANNNFTTSEFFCTQCGRRGIPIVRRAGRQREAGHLKKLYCLNCKEKHNFVEVRPFGEYNQEDFEIEFKNGNFNKEGQRKLPYKQFLMLLRNGEGVDINE